MAVDPTISILLDLYGEMLTDKEREMLGYYYNDDLSLKEIADNEAVARRERNALGESTERETISRQGVRDAIKRAEGKLKDWESKLHLVEQSQRRAVLLEKLADTAKSISSCNISHTCIKEINDSVTEMLSLINELGE